MRVASQTVGDASRYLRHVLWFVTESSYARHGAEAGGSDFCFGNPHEMPLSEIPRAIAKWSEPQNKDWFAYMQSDPTAVRSVVGSLRERVGIDFDEADVSMASGAFGGLAATLRALLDPGDEVIYLSPPWFFYVPMMISLGAKPIRVDFKAPGFRLPVEAIERAITDRTRLIIVNSPHNPSGRIFDADELERLGVVLRKAKQPLYLVSDESYSRILFDSRQFRSPLHHYDRSILVYTYGKTLLAPGQRLGYIALSPRMPDRAEVMRAVVTSQIMTWAFPNAVMQYALPDLDGVSVDVAALQRRRDRMTAALRDMGYETVVPEGTFYILVRSPVANDIEFTELLATHKVFVMPGEVFELPGWFRISLTANDTMVERSFAGFQRARDEAQAGKL